MTDKQHPFPDPVIRPSKEHFCSRCQRLRPVEEFRYLGQRGHKEKNFCRDCHDNGSRRRKKAQTKERKAIVGQLVTGLVTHRIEAPHISELCEQMFKRFGGTEQFSLFWYGEIQAAFADDKTSRTVRLNHLLAMTKLVNMSTEHRQSAPDMADLSDADLEREVDERLRLHGPVEEEADDGPATRTA